MTKAIALKTTTAVSCIPSAAKAAVDEVLAGRRALAIPSHNNPLAGLNNINILGLALLENALYEMSPYERQFAGNMSGIAGLSDKQRSFLKRISKQYLGLDIDSEDCDLSVAVASASKAAKSKSKVSRVLQ